MANTFKLYWIADDCQADMLMGEFDSLQAARDAQPNAEQEIIDQGGDPDGFWKIDERDDEDEIVATHDC